MKSRLSILANRHVFHALLFVALAARAMVPAGWMPVADSGGLRLVPCTGTAPAPVTTEARGHEAHSGHHGGASQTPDDEEPPAKASGSCAFAAAPAVPLPLAVAAAPVRFDREPPLGLAGTAVAIGGGLVAPPPPSTGPPLPA